MAELTTLSCLTGSQLALYLALVSLCLHGVMVAVFFLTLKDVTTGWDNKSGEEDVGGEG